MHREGAPQKRGPVFVAPQFGKPPGQANTVLGRVSRVGFFFTAVVAGRHRAASSEAALCCHETLMVKRRVWK